MRRRKQFISVKDVVKGIVHGVRNPLNALQLNIDNLEGEIEELKVANTRSIPQLFTRIKDTVAELDYFLSGVLRLADLPKPQITPLDINASVMEVETFAKPKSSEKELIVKINLQENLPEIKADPFQLKEAILSVLLNAIDACPVKGSITLATETNNNHIIVKVIDNGRGIPLALQNRIFEPFFSTKEVGAGLGLPLALEIVKMYGGSISFTCEVGKGTTFCICLPIEKDIGRKECAARKF